MELLAEFGGIGGLTASGMLLLAVFLIMRGDLVARKVHEEVKQERDKWRQAAEKSDSRADALSNNLKELLDSQKTIVAIAEAIQGLPEIDSEVKK